MATEKKLKLVILLIIAPFFAMAQERQILDWAFFKNDRPANAEHQAFTWSNISYQYKYLKTDGEKIEFQFNVTLKMDTAKSYFEKNKRLMNDTRLLQHEQGHADIAFIYALKLKEIFAKTSFSTKNYQNEIKNVFAKILEDMRADQLKYDAESEHSKNQEGQKKWDLYFENAVKSS
jgi:predicted secreted Zn-dependent protease